MKLTYRFVVLFPLLCAQVLCEHGRHHQRHHSSHPHCQNCPPGWGVTSSCTKLQQTGCSPCQPGYYSRHHSFRLPCWPCSRCGVGLFISHECTSTRDTVCDSCYTHHKPHSSEDFRIKCQNSTWFVLVQTNDSLAGDGFNSPEDSYSYSTDSSQIAVIVLCICLSAVAIFLTACYTVKNCNTIKYKELQEVEAL